MASQGRSKSKKKQQEAYKSQGRYEKNKRLRAERHKKKHPNDKTVPGTVPSYAPNREKLRKKLGIKLAKSA